MSDRNCQELPIYRLLPKNRHGRKTPVTMPPRRPGLMPYNTTVSNRGLKYSRLVQCVWNLLWRRRANASKEKAKSCRTPDGSVERRSSQRQTVEPEMSKSSNVVVGDRPDISYARPAAVFPLAEYHDPLVGTKLTVWRQRQWRAEYLPTFFSHNDALQFRIHHTQALLVIP